MPDEGMGRRLRLHDAQRIEPCNGMSVLIEAGGEKHSGYWRWVGLSSCLVSERRLLGCDTERVGLQCGSWRS